MNKRIEGQVISEGGVGGGRAMDDGATYFYPIARLLGKYSCC